jgi:acetylornithine/N-succinyldiaminopimelate aminotransferase
MESLQGEGGIYPANKEFMEGVAKLCKEKDILLILDEIQCGMGRTGKMFAFQHYNVKPDIITCAKALGAGVPVGAFVVSERVAKASLTPGDHGTTYGGNPLVCTAVAKSISMMEEMDLPNKVATNAEYLEKSLDVFVEKYDFVKTHRGMGYMQGLVLTIPVKDVVSRCLEEGLVVLSAGRDVLRLLPPLVTTREELLEGFDILDRVFGEFA